MESGDRGAFGKLKVCRRALHMSPPPQTDVGYFNSCIPQSSYITTAFNPFGPQNILVTVHIYFSQNFRMTYPKIVFLNSSAM
jgi:hypothetical protein